MGPIYVFHGEYIQEKGPRMKMFAVRQKRFATILGQLKGDLETGWVEDETGLQW